MFYKSFTGQVFILNSSLNQIINVYRPPKNIYWLQIDVDIVSPRGDIKIEIF
jgi:hypothetical protein